MTRCISPVHSMDGMDETEVMGGRSSNSLPYAGCVQIFGAKKSLSKIFVLRALVQLCGPHLRRCSLGSRLRFFQGNAHHRIEQQNHAIRVQLRAIPDGSSVKNAMTIC